MAKDCSFDVVSEFDKQELVNAVDQVKRDLTSRFDLKNSNSSIELEGDKSITITTNDEMKLRNIFDILQTKLVKRSLSIKILDAQPIENALGEKAKVRQGKAYGGCLGVQRRRRAWQAARSHGERQAGNEPWIPEWGNPAGAILSSRKGSQTRRTETSK